MNSGGGGGGALNHLPLLFCKSVYSGKIEIQTRPALFRNPQSFVDCSIERPIRYNVLIELQRIQRKLSSDYSLNIHFSRRFPYNDGPPFSQYKPLQNVDFSKVGNMQLFFRDFTHILVLFVQLIIATFLSCCFTN